LAEIAVIFMAPEEKCQSGKAVEGRWLHLVPWAIIGTYGALNICDITGVLPAEKWSPFHDVSLGCTYLNEESVLSDISSSKPVSSPMEDQLATPQIGRKLSSDSTASSGSSGGHSGPHQHDALLYLFSTVIIGTIFMHLSMLPQFESMPQTVVLFLMGIIVSVLMQEHGGNLAAHLGKFGESFNMWMLIDPHLLLFTLLPGLLTGDAMTIDTAVARRVAKQCLYLAGPGVIINSFLTAAFLYVYLQYDWDFLLCLTLGSIFAATDPVAVVGLLKELGASPVLTVQIQGESLLNDGTAIVLWTVAYDMYKGTEYDAGGIIIFGVKVALCAALLGFAIGWVFTLWIRFSSNRFSHFSAVIQISLTICCAYVSFVVSEGILGISGVLCTVCSALVLADNMWPDIVAVSSVHDVWHMLEYLGNTIIFFLAGCLFGNCMVDIPWYDYFHLLVIYISQVLLRGMLMFGSRPLLRMLSPDNTEVTKKDCAVMTWGGLRGAVGLALAMVVSHERGGDKLDYLNSSRVLFYTGGLAALTLCVNATTCPALVGRLGITKTPEARRRLLLGICAQMHAVMDEQVSDVINATINQTIHEIYHHIEDSHGHDQTHEARCSRSSRKANEKDDMKGKTPGEQIAITKQSIRESMKVTSASRSLIPTEIKDI
jgi:NhaP-type Na+/H+ or K+/H+ antiporter